MIRNGTRAFLALDLAEPARSEAARRMESLASCAGCIRWTEAANLHVTVKFLGDSSAGLLEALKAGMKDALMGTANFELRLSGIGAFPSLERPRVLWMGIAEGAEQTADLASRAERAAAASGYAADHHRYIPHVTIARIRFAEHLRPALDSIRADGFSAVETTAVRDLRLYSSRLTAEGPVYTREYSWSLQP